jgi:ADP-ribose pyrophosphatase YjhB (NUDIX family)
MDIKKEIEEYSPIGEQEIKDKELILNYLDTFENIFTRENELVHFTTSAFVVNKNKDKLLMIYHNIYNSWGWIGGHTDGDKDLFKVIKKEIEEETGIKNLNPIVNQIFLLELLPVKGHIRKGKYVAPHIHISIDYLFEADEKEKLIIKEDENSGVKWIPISEVVSSSTEPHMQVIYQKAINKIKNLS